MDEVKQRYYKLQLCPLTRRKYCHHRPRRGPSGARVEDTCPHFQIRNGVHYCMFHPNMLRLRTEHEQMCQLLLVRPDKYAYVVEESSFNRAIGGFTQTNRHIASTLEKAITWAQAHLDILEDAVVAGVPASFSILEWETDNEEWDGEHICVGWIRSDGTFVQPEHGAHREVANGLR